MIDIKPRMLRLAPVTLKILKGLRVINEIIIQLIIPNFSSIIIRILCDIWTAEKMFVDNSFQLVLLLNCQVSL